jgi:hypothetical protein
MNTLLAQKLTLPGQAPIQGPLQSGDMTTIGGILSKAMPLIFVFAGIGLFLMILGSGFDFLTSAGDEKKLQSGKQRLTYAIVGFIIIFSAFWLVQIFGAMFGLETIQKSFQ